MIATIHGHTEIVKLLIGAGARIDGQAEVWLEKIMRK